MANTLIKDLKKQLSGLKKEYEKAKPHHEEISCFVFPNGGYFDDRDSPSNHDEKKYSEIYDSSPGNSLRVAASGIASGLTPQASTWGSWTPRNENLLEVEAVSQWAHDVSNITHDILQNTNFYKEILKSYYEDLAFGTSSIFCEFHPTKWLHFDTYTAGEYYFLVNKYKEPDTVFKVFYMQTYSMVDAFGIDNVSDPVKQNYNKNEMTVHHQVCAVVRPLPKTDTSQFKYEMIYFETSASDATVNPLLTTKYFTLPTIVSRWNVLGSETWGRSPTMDALADIKLLHRLHREKLKGLAYEVDPATGVIDGALKDKRATAGPGDTVVFNASAAGTTQPPMFKLFEVRVPYAELLQEISDLRGSISTTMFADLLRTLNIHSPKATATEVLAATEQDQRILSPIIGNQINDKLIPLMERVFDVLLRAGAYPEPPEELRGQEIVLKMTTSLSQIQKKVESVIIEQMYSYISAVSQTNPEVLDKFDHDQSADEYSKAINVPAGVVRSDDAVKQIRDGRAAAKDLLLQQQQENQSIMAAQELSKTDTGGKNALTDLTEGA